LDFSSLKFTSGGKTLWKSGLFMFAYPARLQGCKAARLQGWPLKSTNFNSLLLIFSRLKTVYAANDAARAQGSGAQS
ncbi:hypothetical protein ACK850_004893, partial [Salmonella enterica]